MPDGRLYLRKNGQKDSVQECSFQPHSLRIHSPTNSCTTCVLMFFLKISDCFTISPQLLSQAHAKHCGHFLLIDNHAPMNFILSVSISNLWPTAAWQSPPLRHIGLRRIEQLVHPSFFCNVHIFPPLEIIYTCRGAVSAEMSLIL